MADLAGRRIERAIPRAGAARPQGPATTIRDDDARPAGHAVSGVFGAVLHDIDRRLDALDADADRLLTRHNVAA